MKKFNLVALAVILVASPLWSGWLQPTQAAYTATLTFANPANGSSKALDTNHRFTIDVNVNTAGQDSIGADVLVDFDATKLSFVAGGSSIANFYPANHYGPIVNGSRISMGATKQAGGDNVNGSGRFATLQFELGSAYWNNLPINVQFSFYYIAQGNTTDSNIASTSISEPDLLAAPASATITLTAYVPAVTAPDITSLEPTSGTTAGGTPVIVHGNNFGTAGAVTFGGTTVTPTGRTDTSMTVTSPAHATGDVYIIVTNSTTGLSSNATDAQARYTYVTPGSTAPNITDINPTQGPIGGNTSVVLTGANFGTTEGTVTIGGQTVNASNVTPWADGSITFTTPAHSVGSVSVSVTTNSGVNSNAVTYTYTDGTSNITSDPNIAYLTPSSGLANQDILVTIVGTNFKPTGLSNGTVRFGSYNATVVSWADTTIQVYAPKLGAIVSDITYDVVVTRSDGKYDTSSYTYLAPASTGGTTTTPSGMPSSVWFGLFSLNGGLAFLVKRKLTKYS